MGQRITRAKSKIKSGPDPVPGPLGGGPARPVSGVLAVLFLIFNEGYLGSDPQQRPRPQRPDPRGDPPDPAAAGAAAGGR